MLFILQLLFDQSKWSGAYICSSQHRRWANLALDTHVRPCGDILGFKSGLLAAYDWSADDWQRQV